MPPPLRPRSINLPFSVLYLPSHLYELSASYKQVSPISKKPTSITASPSSCCSVSLLSFPVGLLGKLSVHCPQPLPSCVASSSTSPGELPSVKPPTSLFPRAAGHSYCPSFLSFLDMRPTPSFLELSPPLSPRQDFTCLSSFSSQFASNPLSSYPSLHWGCSLTFLFCSTRFFMQGFHPTAEQPQTQMFEP